MKLEREDIRHLNLCELTLEVKKANDLIFTMELAATGVYGAEQMAQQFIDIKRKYDQLSENIPHPVAQVIDTSSVSSTSTSSTRRHSSYSMISSSSPSSPTTVSRINLYPSSERSSGHRTIKPNTMYAQQFVLDTNNDKDESNEYSEIE